MSSELWGAATDFQRTQYIIANLTPEELELCFTSTDKNGCTALCVAVQGEDPRIVEILLKAGPPALEIVPHCGLTPLHHATSFGRTEIVEILLKAGANLEASSLHGHTPLYTACSFLQSQIIEIFLNAGANPNIKTSTGATPLHSLFTLYLNPKLSRTPSLLLLLSFGADQYLLNQEGQSALDLARQRNDLKSIDILLLYRHNDRQKNATLYDFLLPNLDN